MKHTKLVILLMVVALSTACAKPKAPPPEPITIPVQLVNVQASAVGEMPERPDSTAIRAIREGDRSDVAIVTTLEYLVALKRYQTLLENKLVLSTQEQDEMRKKLKNIKAYILLQQANQP